MEGMWGVRAGKFILIPLFLVGLESLAADSAADRRRRLAEAWAPVVFHSVSEEFTDPETGFNPVDNLVDFFFDGNEDVRDNGLTIYRLSLAKRLQLVQSTGIYYSVIETTTHIYINYVFYHAVDLNIFQHTHDTENMWLVLHKGEAPFGAFEAAVLNSHGYPMIYAKDVETERRWRSKVRFGLAKKFLPLMDAQSKEHHEEGDIVRWGRHLAIYVSPKTHALYKWNPEAWTSGVAYFLQGCVSCYYELKEEVTDVKARAYQLLDFDELWNRAHDDTSSKDFLFVPAKNPLDMNEEPDRPAFLTPAIWESRPSANLFFRNRFKTPYDLSDPAKMHRYFEGTDEGISRAYVYNPYLVVNKKPQTAVPQFREASWPHLFGILRK